MIPEKKDIKIFQGKSFLISYILKNNDSTIIDISDYIINFYIKGIKDNETLITYSSNDDNSFISIDGLNGKFTINLISDETIEFLYTSDYELEIITDDITPYTYTIFNGKIIPILTINI